MLKSKIHRAIVTETDLNYDGSITIDKELMQAADILPYEKVEVMNVNTGARFETYAIEGREGEIKLNGACARLAMEGDIVIILTYEIQYQLLLAENYKPIIVYVAKDNAITSRVEYNGE